MHLEHILSLRWVSASALPLRRRTRALAVSPRARYFFFAFAFARAALAFSIRSRSASACCTVLNFDSSPRRSVWRPSRNAGSVACERAPSRMAASTIFATRLSLRSGIGKSVRAALAVALRADEAGGPDDDEHEE